MIANQATGNVRQYQAVCGTIQLLILPISYVFLRFGYLAYTVFIVHFTIESFTQIVRMFMLRPMIKIRLVDYISYIYKPVSLVVLGSIILPFFLFVYIDGNGIIKFLLIVLTCFCSVAFSSYTLGLSTDERKVVSDKIKKIAHKIK